MRNIWVITGNEGKVVWHHLHVGVLEAGSRCPMNSASTGRSGCLLCFHCSCTASYPYFLSVGFFMIMASLEITSSRGNILTKLPGAAIETNCSFKQLKAPLPTIMKSYDLTSKPHLKRKFTSTRGSLGQLLGGERCKHISNPKRKSMMRRSQVLFTAV